MTQLMVEAQRQLEYDRHNKEPSLRSQTDLVTSSGSEHVTTISKVIINVVDVNKHDVTTQHAIRIRNNLVGVL